MFGTSVAGTLSESSNKRYYKFSLNEAGSLNFGMEKIEYFCSTDIKIYDASQTEIYSNHNGSCNSFSLNPIYLTGKNYYMAVNATCGETTFSFIAPIVATHFA